MLHNRLRGTGLKGKRRPERKLKLNSRSWRSDCGMWRRKQGEQMKLEHTHRK
jgi:hypothetical protein